MISYKCFNMFCRSWRKIGAVVIVKNTDLLKNDNHVNLLNEANKLGLVEGLFIIYQPKSLVLDIVNQASIKMCPNIK